MWFFEKRGTQEIYPPGGVYFFLPLINAWSTLPISQQNLLMTANANEGDRLGRDDITFKTKDGNNVYIDVNVMWRIDPEEGGLPRLERRAERARDQGAPRQAPLPFRHPRRVQRDHERGVLPGHREEPHGGEGAKEQLSKELEAFGVLIDQLQVQQHRFDKEYQEAINAQKQAEADVQTLIEQQKNMFVQKQSELEGKRSEWNKRLEDALGEAGPNQERGGRLLPDEDEPGEGHDRGRAGRGRGRAQGSGGALEARRGRVREDAGRQAVRAEEDPHRPGLERLDDERERDGELPARQGPRSARGRASARAGTRDEALGIPRLPARFPLT